MNVIIAKINLIQPFNHTENKTFDVCEVVIFDPETRVYVSRQYKSIFFKVLKVGMSVKIENIHTVKLNTSTKRQTNISYSFAQLIDESIEEAANKSGLIVKETAQKNNYIFFPKYNYQFNFQKLSTTIEVMRSHFENFAIAVGFGKHINGRFLLNSCLDKFLTQQYFLELQNISNFKYREWKKKPDFRYLSQKGIETFSFLFNLTGIQIDKEVFADIINNLQFRNNVSEAYNLLKNYPFGSIMGAFQKNIQDDNIENDYCITSPFETEQTSINIIAFFKLLNEEQLNPQILSTNNTLPI